MDKIRKFENSLNINKEFPKFSSGDSITVYYEITEGVKTRIQFFKGVVIQKRGQGITQTFTVRKISQGIGVERIFCVSQTSIKKIEVNKKGIVRRARIFYLRGLKGKKSKIKEKKRS